MHVGAARRRRTHPGPRQGDTDVDDVYRLRVAADVAATFRSDAQSVNVVNISIALAWTWMSAPAPRGPDVHPNAIGYLAIASAFAKAISHP